MGDLPKANEWKIQANDADFDGSVDIHVDREPEIAAIITELLTVGEVELLHWRREPDHIVGFEIDLEQGKLFVEYFQRTFEERLQCSARLNLDGIEQFAILRGDVEQGESVEIESVRMGDAHKGKSGNFDVIGVEIGEKANAGEVEFLADVRRLVFVQLALTCTIGSIPIHHRCTLTNRNNGGVVFDALAGVSIGFVCEKTGLPKLFSRNHLLHDGQTRVFAGDDNLFHLQDFGLEADLQWLGRRGCEGKLLHAISDKAHDKGCGQGVWLDGEASFAIADGAAVGVFDGDGCGRQGFSGGRVEDGAFDLEGFGLCRWDGIVLRGCGCVLGVRIDGLCGVLASGCCRVDERHLCACGSQGQNGEDQADTPCKNNRSGNLADSHQNSCKV